MLKDFYQNKELRTEVKTYLIDFLNQEIIKKAYAGEDTKAVGEAKVVLDKAFENLDTIFSPKPKKIVVKNAAR